MRVKQACAIAAFILLGITQASAEQTASKPSAAKAAKASAAKAGAAQTMGEGIAAVVNDDVISTFDVRQRSSLILASSGIPPSPDALNQVKSQALRALVDERLEVQEAKRKKIVVGKKEIDEAIGQIAKANNATVQQFTANLTRSGISVTTLRAQIEAEIAWRRLVNGRYGSRVRISRTDVQDTLNRIQSSASKPQFQMSEILLPANTEKEYQDAEVAAERLLKELQAGRATFAAIARQFSAAPTAAAGGDLGWLSESDLRPDLKAAAEALKPGQVSSPVRTDQGVEIIALREARAGVDAKVAARVKLRQISAPATARTALDRARVRIRGCDSIDKATSSVSGVQVVDLGEMAEADLSEEMRSRVAETGLGQASDMIDTAQDASFVVVCGRDTAGGLLPSRDQIEDRLYDQEIALLSQRYLMDLRRDSTIITR